MAHSCLTCGIDNGPVAMGFAPGPIVGGETQAIPVTTCTICKQPVRVEPEVTAESAVANPLQNKGVQRSSKKPPIASPDITGKNILTAARARVRELNRAIKESEAWRKERDELVRLLNASKPSASITPLKVAR